MNHQVIDLDINKDFNNTCISIAQGDKYGLTLTARVYDNGAPMPVDTFTACLVVLLPDKRHYARQLCETHGNEIQVTINENTLASVPGYTDEAYFTLTSRDITYSTARFALDIKRSALIDHAAAQTWDSAVQELVTKSEKVITETTTVKNQALEATKTASTAADTANSVANDITEKAKTGVLVGIKPVNAAKDAANAAAESANSASIRATTAAEKAEQAVVGARYIVDEGTTPEGWTYECWDNGKYECHGIFEMPPMTINKPFGVKFSGDEFYPPAYPKPFARRPTHTVTTQASEKDGKPTDGETVSGGTTTNPPRIIPTYIRAESKPYVYEAHIHVYGFWK